MGRPADPKRRRRGTGNRPQAGETPPAPVVVALTGVEVDVVHPWPAAPVDLPDDAVPIWDVVMEELWARGLRESDVDGVRILVTAAYRNRQVAAAINKTGPLVASATGQLSVNPLLRIEKDTAATYLRYAEAFGLTVASRLRLGLIQLAGETLLQALTADLDREA